MAGEELFAVSSFIIGWIMCIIAVDEWWRGRKKEKRELEEKYGKKKKD